MIRSVAFGVISAAVLLWLTFFSGPGAPEIATLAAAGVACWWLATVDPRRLVNERNRPHGLLFGLALMGCALLITAAALIASATTFLILAVGVAGIVTGFVRAVRWGMDGAPLEE